MRVTISAGADPAFRDCRISDVEGIGLATAAGARGVLQGCEITRIAGTAVAFRERSLTRMTSSYIHEVGHVGVLMESQARPVLEDCEIRDTGSHGMVLTGEADPVVRPVLGHPDGRGGDPPRRPVPRLVQRLHGGRYRRRPAWSWARPAIRCSPSAGSAARRRPR